MEMEKLWRDADRLIANEMVAYVYDGLIAGNLSPVRLDGSTLTLCIGIPQLKDPGDLFALSELADSVLSQRFDSDKLIILHTRKARFTFEKPVPWTRDGEDGGMHQTLELRNLQAPIRFVF